MVRSPTNAILSQNQVCRDLRAHGGVAEGVGVTIFHKNDDVIYEQPIYRRFTHVEFEEHLHDCMSVSYFC